MQASKIKNKTWLSIHIFYHQQHDFLLVKGVKPFVKKLITSKLIEKFFFIRYHVQGSHIRLRLFGDEEILYGKVKKTTQNYFERFIKKYPSERPKELHQSYSSKLHPNNSVQFIMYEQEFDRYGSEIGMGIAQSSFEASSIAILEAIENGGLNNSNHLIPAIQMHTAFLAAIFDKKSAIEFLNYNIKIWLPKLLLLTQNNDPMHPLNKKQIREGFISLESKFKDQPGCVRIMEMILSIWKGVKKRNAFEENWLNNWIASTKTIHKMVLKGLQKKQLKIHFSYPQYLLPVSGKNKRIIALYDSYIHMTNNRFGILNFDESLISFFILKSISATN